MFRKHCLFVVPGFILGIWVLMLFPGSLYAEELPQNLSPAHSDVNVSTKKQNLLERKTIPLDAPAWTQIKEDVGHLFQQIHSLTLKETWPKKFHGDWKPGWIQLIAFLILLGFALVLLSKLSNYGKGLLTHIDKNQFPYRHMTLLLFRQSILLMGVTLFIYVYTLVTPMMTSGPLFWLVVWVLMIVLFTRLAEKFVHHLLLEKRWIHEREAAILSTLLSGIRYFSIAYVTVDWLIKSDSMVLFVIRLLMAVFILFQVVQFWKTVQNRSEYPEAKPGKVRWTIMFITKGLSYAIMGAGIVLDLSGYNALALYWYKSWGISIVIFLWAGLFFKLFMEWRLYLKTTILDSSEEADRTGQSIRWLILQLLWLVWFFSVVLSVLLAWGGKQTVIVGFIHLLNYPVTIGNIHFSIMNFIYAFLILVVTQSLTRFWKFILKKKILAGSGLETGLQDSITMITIYTFWVFGILLSLHAFGLGTTSMALAFGALGIGLGFGLQNIFNNFISGIILLFERPIQVGDDVEINGVWATVKKINVRATVVQTYDNASLIIPNSEFISSQVTNWSFKDKRIRRNIDVGVAYGSNIELVREILLEIADNTPRVFKSPKPDVVFRDFGDSALVFRLRVWTDIDNIFKVETAIRFAIDRRFNESGIVIAFPQRDVHVYNENKESTGI